MICARRSVWSLLLAAVLALAPGIAHAQSASGPTVTAVPIAPYPTRYLNSGTPSQVDLGTSTRPQGLTPLGINYDDCVSDMTLEYSVILSVMSLTQSS